MTSFIECCNAILYYK